jgi:hypothetical protein
LLSTLHLVKGDIILVDSIGRDMPLKTLVKLVDQLETLAKNNAAVIYLTQEKKVEVESAYPAQDVYECSGWAEEVKAHRFLLEKKV